MDISAFFVWLAAFFDNQFLTIALATFILFLIMLVTWWVYRKLSRRNLFNLFKRTKEKEHPTAMDHVVYGLKLFFIFPVLIFIGFLIFSFALFVLMKPSAEQQAQVLFIAIVLVSTIRVGAYVHENLAEDLAKLIPLSLLAAVLMQPDFSNIGVSLAQVTEFFLLMPGFLKYLIFTVTLEILLRGGTWLFFNLNREDSAPSS
jgi:hypothetical protein